MVSILSSPSGQRHPLWRIPLALSSSLSRSRTVGWRRSCMIREVLALAVVAKEAKISSMVDSCEIKVKEKIYLVLRRYNPVTLFNTFLGILCNF